MALIRCPECGRQISDDAAMCMGCGKPMEKIREQLAAEKAEAEKLKAEKEAARLQAEKEKAEKEAARLQAEKEKAEKAANKPANGKKPIGLFIALAAVIAVIAVVMVIVSGTGKVKAKVITFGAYEQDNDLTNGKEPIEWIVLDVDKKTNRALVISRYGLDAHRFDASWYHGWDKSEIREWLNSTFLNAAFTAEEQKAIATTTVKTGNNDEWVALVKKKGWVISRDNLNGGADTQDKVFLLSLEEVMAYGGYSTVEDFYNRGTDKMKAVPTKYAVAQGAFQSGWAGRCTWWLRSPGCSSCNVSTVNYGGSLGYSGVSNTFVAIRPAFWLNLDSIIP